MAKWQFEMQGPTLDWPSVTADGVLIARTYGADAETNARAIAALPNTTAAARAMLAALRNPAGLDEGALLAMDLHTLRATLREYRDEARSAIGTAEAAGITAA